MPMTRRHFLQQAATAAVALTTAPSLLADPLGLPIGCQTYPVRASINPDFAGTMKGLSRMGATGMPRPIASACRPSIAFQTIAMSQTCGGLHFSAVVPK